MLEAERKPKPVTFSAKRTGPTVTVRALIGLFEHCINWLRTLDPDSPTEWEVVRVSMGKRVTIKFSNPTANGAISRNMGELNALQRIKPPPTAPRLTDALIDSTRELAQVAMSNEFESVNISSPGERGVKITAELVRRVDALAKSPRIAQRTEWTTLEGIMDQVTVEAGTEKSRFRINHPLTGAEIPCTFDQATVNLNEVKKALPHRVAVYGRAKLDRAGKVLSIEVSKLQQLRDASDFPSISEIPRTDITGGMESSDYVERVRGGD